MKTIITLDDKNFGGNHYHAAHIEQIGENNIRLSKYISIPDLLSALTNSIVSEDRFYRMGKMPQNYYDGTILRDEHNQISGKVALAVPKHRRTILFENTEYMICFPSLFFCFSIAGGRIKQTKLFALKGNRWKDEDFLYNYPFGNVSTYAHEVCWGSNQLPQIETLQTLDVVISLFYDSATNNDLYSMEQSTVWKENNLRGVLDRLNGKKEFPEKILVRGNCDTIGCFLKRNF